MSKLEDWQLAATLSQLRTGEAYPTKLRDKPIALYLLEGQVYAIDDICTHEYAQLSQGFVEGREVECPLHQAKFDIATGKCLAPPATVDLKRYPVRIEGDEIYVGTQPSN